MLIKKDGEWLTRVELRKVLSEIFSDSNSRLINPIRNCVSVLTSDARPNWAKARNLLIKGLFEEHLKKYDRSKFNGLD
jgi:hypothetical protein